MDRKLAISWWNQLSLEKQFYKLIECNHLITGDRTRHPNSLTGREVEIVYNFYK
jgi:hypothetical protein